MTQMLDAIFSALPSATELPSGRYRGIAPVDLTRPLWQGKVFRGETVTNLLFDGVEGIQGRVQLVYGEVKIMYPKPLKSDKLKPLGPHAWLGRYESSAGRIYFCLVKE